MNKFYLIFLLLSILGNSCIRGIPVLTTDDEKFAKTRWPEVTNDQLNRGRELYIKKCSGCHSLYKPEELKQEKLESILGKMADISKLDPDQKELIFRYLYTASEIKLKN